MRKEGGWQRYHSIGLALSSSRCDFQTNWCQPHPVRGIKQLSEPCFYDLQTRIVSQRRTKNCWRYLNFADFFKTGGGGQHSLVVCSIAIFLKVGGFFKVASPMIAVTLKLLQRCYQHRWRTFARYLTRFMIKSDYYRHLKYRWRCTIALFQLSVWCEKCVAARHYADIGKQFFISNDRNRVRWVVLGLSQDGPCTDFVENFGENSLKGDLSNDNIVKPPFFSLGNTFKGVKIPPLASNPKIFCKLGILKSCR